MSTFCGIFDAQGAENKTTAYSTFQNACFLDGLGFVPHVVLVLITLPMFILLMKSRSEVKGVMYAHLPGHTVRWIFTLFLIVINIYQIADGIIAEVEDVGGHMHLYVTHMVALVGSVFSIIYYHSVEIQNAPRALLLLLCYWSACLLIKGFKLAHLYDKHVGIHYMRFHLAWDNVIIYTVLLGVELNVLRRLRYALFKERYVITPPEELSRTNYVYSYVNFLSKITFFWINRLLLIGYKKHLELKDLGALPLKESAAHNFQKLYKVVEKFKKGKSGAYEASLLQISFRTFRPMIALAALYKLLGDLLSFVGPLCIQHIVHYVEEKEQLAKQPRNQTVDDAVVAPYVKMLDFFSNGFVLAVTVFIATICQNLLLQNYYFLSIRDGIRLRAALQAMVYRKSLHLSPFVLTSGEKSIGNIVNHLAVDSNTFFYLFCFMHNAWAVPLKMIITLVLLYFQLGYSALIGASLLLVLSPLQFVLASFHSRVQKKTLAHSDERIKQCNELIQSILLLKLYAWETMFTQGITEARKREMRQVLKGACIRAITVFATESAPVMMMLVAFTLYPYFQGQPLTAAKAFTSLALFNLLAVPMFTLPMVMNTIVNSRVSAKRMADFFTQPEVEPYMPKPQLNTMPRDTKVEYHNANKQVPVVMIVEPQESHDERKDLLEGKQKSLTIPQTGMRKSATVCESPDCSPWPSPNSSPLCSPQQSPKLRRQRSSEQNLSTAHKYEDASPEEKLSRSTNSLSEMDEQDKKHALHARKISLGVGLKGKRKRRPSSMSMFDDDFIDPNRGVGVAVELKGASFAWDPESTEPDLEDINVSIGCGQLTMIVGSVGAGKTSLLCAMLKEMSCISGFVDWKPGVNVAYVAQQPWLMNATLQDNILFGLPMDKKRYKRVTSACALQPDMQILPAGDLTEIGEKGINLSGGQKQRVSLARALYSRADVILMDDPLSALDVHVGAHIFEDGIMKFCLRRKRTIILTTHHLNYLRHAHKVIRMADGIITHQGALPEILEKDPSLGEHWQSLLRQSRATDLLGIDSQSNQPSMQDLASEPPSPPSDRERRGYGDNIETERSQLQKQVSSLEFQRKRTQSIFVPTLPVPKDAKVKEFGGLPSIPQGLPLTKQLSAASSMSRTSLEVGDGDGEGRKVSFHSSMTDLKEEGRRDALKVEEKGRLIVAEERERGSVSWQVYLAYISSCTWILVILFFLIQFCYQGASIATNYWLTEWSHSHKGNNTGEVQHEPMYYVRIYAVLAGATVISALISSFLSIFAGYQASLRLHLNMLQNIVLLPMRFFDTTPKGRIITRFSADTNIIDDKLPSSAEALVRTVLQSLAAIIVNVMATPFFILAVLPVMVLYYIMQKFYRASSRELQRLDSLSKSPVLAHLSETLGGLTTIRAYRDQQRFKHTLLQRIDSNNTAFLYLHTTNRWLAVRLDFLGAVIVFLAAIASISVALQGYINSGMVGLAIAYSLMMSNYLNWLVRMLTDTETQMNSVERVQHYSTLDTEPYKEDDYVKPPADWPKAGVLVFHKVSVRYDESLAPVVKDVTLEIKAGSKVGICGRTGSGKTSLVMSLFRMVQICEGEISIDGINIEKVPLHDLRSRLSIIPQDPTLFAGTIRYNLDPEGVSTDHQLWDILELAQMKELVKCLSQELDTDVSSGGENLSAGQRQLLCLARAVLKNSSVIVLDEATASIDMETDATLQEVLMTTFMSKTVITIAHRVTSLVNYDQIIVMDEGRVIEYDTPENLLANESSAFTGLLKGNK